MSVKKKVNLLENFSRSTGCFLKKGKLVPGYGIGEERRMIINASTFKLTYSEAAKKYAYSTDERVYITADFLNIVSIVHHKGTTHFYVEDYVDGVKRFVVIYGNTAAVCINSVCTEYWMRAVLKCGVMHRGRLFGANGFDIWWSGPGGVIDWEEGIGGCGRLSLDTSHGEVLDMAVYGGKIIVVREHGLTVLSMNSGSPENFSVDITDTDCDRIYKDTSQVIEGKFYFFSETGLKCFDGTVIHPVRIRHEVKEPWSSTKYDGVYFLACKSEELGRDVILCVDLEDGESCIIAEQAELLFSTKDSVWFTNDRYHYKLKKNSSFIFESEVDFGTGGDKTITKIECDGSPSITVNNGKFTRRIKTLNGVARPRMRGKSFKVTIAHDKPIKWATAYAEVTDAV